MKNPLFLLLLLVSGFLPAQTIQSGKTRELNSNKATIGNVDIQFADAVPTASDGSGNFRVVFSEKSPGEYASVNIIRKSGYELVNEKELRSLRITNTAQLAVDIILAKAGVIDQAKREYYQISEQALTTNFEREKEELVTRLRSSQLSQAQYEAQVKKLEEQLELQKASLEALADKFARVNFDDVSATYQEALRLFKNGDIEGCKAKLESADLLGRTSRRLAERERITLAQAELAQQGVDNERGIQEDISMLQLQIDTYLLTFEFDKAERNVDQLVLLDGNNLSILEAAARFYQEQARYQKAGQILEKILNNSKANSSQKALARATMGDIQLKLGNLNQALADYTRAQAAYEVLVGENPESFTMMENYYLIFGKIGDVHMGLGDPQSAIPMYKSVISVFTALRQQYSSHQYMFQSAQGALKYATALAQLEQWEEAKGSFEDVGFMAQEFLKVYPDDLSLYILLMEALVSSGDIRIVTNQPSEALRFYEDYYRGVEKLYQSFPSPDNQAGFALAHLKLGETNLALGQGDRSNDFLTASIRLYRELYQKYPNNLQFSNGLALAYFVMADLQFRAGNRTEAKAAMQEAGQIWTTAIQLAPEVPEFRQRLSMVEQALQKINE